MAKHDRFGGPIAIYFNWMFMLINYPLLGILIQDILLVENSFRVISSGGLRGVVPRKLFSFPQLQQV